MKPEKHRNKHRKLVGILQAVVSWYSKIGPCLGAAVFICMSCPCT